MSVDKKKQLRILECVNEKRERKRERERENIVCVRERKRERETAKESEVCEFDFHYLPRLRCF